MEIKVRLHDNLISSARSINEPPVEIGEKVDVFIYRLFAINGDEIQLINNLSLKDESVFI